MGDITLYTDYFLFIFFFFIHFNLTHTHTHTHTHKIMHYFFFFLQVWVSMRHRSPLNILKIARWQSSHPILGGSDVLLKLPGAGGPAATACFRRLADGGVLVRGRPRRLGAAGRGESGLAAAVGAAGGGDGAVTANQIDIGYYNTG